MDPDPHGSAFIFPPGSGSAFNTYADPDPHGSAFIFPPGSGFAFNTYADPDPGGENLRRKTQKCKEIGNFIVKY